MDQSRARMMGEEKISIVLRKLAIPGVVAMMIAAIYNIVDTAFVGMLHNTEAMAAVSVAFPLFMLIGAVGQMFGVGSASYVSRLLGEKNTDKAHKTASTTFFTAIIISILFTIFGLMFIEPILRLFGASGDVMPYAKSYSIVLMAGSLFTIMNMTMNNLIRAEGNALYSMFAIALGSILNIILDPIFMFVLDLGVQGAAIATVVGQMISTAFLLGYYLRGKSIIKIRFKHIRPTKVMYKEILKIGIPTFSRQALTSIAQGLINTAAVPFGVAAVAAMGISMKVFIIPLYIVMGVCQGFQPLAGYNYGAKSFDRLKQAIRATLKVTTLICTIAAIAFLLFTPQVIRLFNSDPEVIEIGVKSLRLLSLLLPTLGFQTAYATLFQALGKGKEALVLSISRQGLFLIPAAIILPKVFGLTGIMLAQPVADILTLALTSIVVIRLNKTLKKEEMGEAVVAS